MGQAATTAVTIAEESGQGEALYLGILWFKETQPERFVGRSGW